MTKDIKNFKDLKEHFTSNLFSAPIEKRIIALEMLNEKQTSDEIRTKSTRHKNRQGFTKVDAPVMASLLSSAKLHKNQLTAKQDNLLKKKLKKYTGQICHICLEKKLIRKINGKYVWGARLTKIEDKLIKKKEIVKAAKEWVNLN